MTRALRIQYEGAHYHIMAKGNNDEYIFQKAKDKDHLIDLLSQGQEKYKVEIYAYCILGNHYHLLMQTPQANLADFMQYVGSAYGSYLVRKEWKGHVFSGRYRSICIDREEYLMTLSRYIHLNPVSARITKLPEDYSWSSYIYYTGRIKPPSWLSTEWIIDYFGPGNAEAAQRYREFVKAGIEEGVAYPDDHLLGGRILGKKEFADKIIARLKEKPVSKEIRESRELSRELTIEKVFKAVCESFGVDSLQKRGCQDRERLQKARRVFILLAKDHTISTNREIAEIMGGIKPNTISSQHYKISTRCWEDRQFLEDMTKEVVGIFSTLKGNSKAGS